MSVKGEKYASKKAMMKHETTEGPAARMKEYGSKFGGIKKNAAAQKAAVKKVVPQKNAVKKATPKKAVMKKMGKTK